MQTLRSVLNTIGQPIRVITTMLSSLKPKELLGNWQNYSQKLYLPMKPIPVG